LQYQRLKSYQLLLMTPQNQIHCHLQELQLLLLNHLTPGHLLS